MNDTETPDELKPLPGPQTTLIEAGDIFEVFLGGNRGGGKTFAMLLDWLDHQDLYGNKASGLMIRRTYKELEDVIKEAQKIFPGQGANWTNSTAKQSTFVFPNGAEIRFRHLDNDNDALLYQGHQYSRIYIEEVGAFPRPDPILKLIATLRVPGVKCGIRLTANPGGDGIAWLRQRYVDPHPLGYRLLPTEYLDPQTNEITVKHRFYIPCNLRDNVYTNTPDYRANLLEATRNNPALRRAWVNENDWNVIIGAFYPEFDNNRHIIDPFEPLPGWLRFMVIDWGSSEPCAIGWFCVVGDNYMATHRGTPVLLPRGAIVMYKEVYFSENHNNVGLQHTAEEVAELICRAERREPKGAEISYRVCDTKLLAVDAGPSIAERMSKPPYELHNFRMAKNKRRGRDGVPAGWDQLRAKLIGVDGRPMIYWFSTCIDSIRTIPLMQHDPDKPGDMVSDGVEDHLSDLCRYAVMSRSWIASGELASISKYYEAEARNSNSVVIKPPPEGWLADLDENAKPKTFKLGGRRI